MSEVQDVDLLYEKLCRGDRVALGQAITLVESTQHMHRQNANVLLDRCTDGHRETFRFAVSGAPGVGKSTLIEALGDVIVDRGHKLAVLTIDPTSPVSHGAILGDKTRMEQLARNPSVFIRPSSAGSILGGVTDRTREVITLCEAAGYDKICVETVGVGQSETEAHGMTDFFLLLVLPGGGDDLQGIKKGIVELADLIAVTKADGIHRAAAKETQQFYAQAVHFFIEKEHGIRTRVMTCSAQEGNRIDALWEAMVTFETETRASGYHGRNRARQDAGWLERRIRQFAQSVIFEHPSVRETYRELRNAVEQQSVSVGSALGQLEQIILTSIKHHEDSA